jgi:hypothetical protein
MHTETVLLWIIVLYYLHLTVFSLSRSHKQVLWASNYMLLCSTLPVTLHFWTGHYPHRLVSLVHHFKLSHKLSTWHLTLTLMLGWFSAGCNCRFLCIPLTVKRLKNWVTDWPHNNAQLSIPIFLLLVCSKQTFWSFSSIWWSFLEGLRGEGKLDIRLFTAYG